MPASSSTCGNPQLAEWLKEWWDEARARGSKGETIYKKAYNSMTACPITFNHPSEASQLAFLGPKLCQRLTDKLRIYCQENDLPMPEEPYKAGRKKDGEDEDGDEARPAKKARKVKAYVPALRSGPYALIRALSTLSEDSQAGMSKAELIEVAQPFCDSSFSAPSDPGKFYTAWSSMKTLQSKDYVYEFGRPMKRYALTEEGWEVAKRINGTMQDETGGRTVLRTITSNLQTTSTTAARTDSGISLKGKESITHASSSRKPAQQKTPEPENMPPVSGAGDFIDLISPEKNDQRTHESLPMPQREITYDQREEGPKSLLGQIPELAQAGPHVQNTPIRIEPGTFTVELILDTREVRSKTDRDYIQNNLCDMGVVPRTSALGLGDAIWVARMKDPDALSRLGEIGTDILLDYICERKRLDDLIGSIKDGRFHEQKFRLKRSGVKNVIYLVEFISLAENLTSKYTPSIETAMASTQIQEDIFVKQTSCLDESIRYFARMTKLLRKMYESKPLYLIPSHTLTPKTFQTPSLRLAPDGTNTKITLETFSIMTSKSDLLCLRDVFVKMLMCIRGISGEKAIEISRKWKTPRELVEAYMRCGSVAEREEMIWNAAGKNFGLKKIGRAFSKRVADTWGA